MSLSHKLKQLFLVLFYLVKHPRRFYNALSARGKRWALRGLIFLLVILIAVPASLWHQAKNAKAAWWNDSWAYRQKIQLTNSTGADLTDFQVSTTVDTATLISAGKMVATTCQDMRFTDSHGNILGYWIEENNPGCGNAATKVWIKAPKVYNGTNATSIYMYYGNPSAGAMQDGNKVFSFFDDFDAASLNTNKWPQHAGESVGSGVVTLDSATDDYAGAEDHIYAASSNVAIDSVTEMRNKAAATNQKDRFGITDQRTIFYQNNINYIGIQNFQDGNLYTDTNNGGALTQTSETAYDTNWHVYKFSWTTNSAKYFSDGSQIREYTTNVPDSSDALHPLLRDQSQTDYIFVHKYASADPSTSSGQEETGPGPIAYWKFDEGQGDTVKNSTSKTGIDGTLGGGTAQYKPSWRTGSECLSGSCLYFDGADDYLEGNISGLPTSGNGTFEFWAKYPSNVSGDDCALSFSDGTTNDNYLNVYPYAGTSGGSNVTVSSAWKSWAWDNTGVSLGANNWGHFAFVADNSNLTLYLNGKSIWTSNRTATPTARTKFKFGNRYATSYPFQGWLDEAKIYPYARSADQVKQDYNAGLAASSAQSGASSAVGESPKWMTDGLVGHWKMDETSGITVADASGNGNTGTLTSAQETNTSMTGSATTTISDTNNANLSTTDDAYNSMILSFSGGSCNVNGQQRTVTDYTGSTKTFTFVALSVAPDTANCTYTVLHQTGGKFGNGLGFEGNNDYVTVADNDSLDITTAHTISAWIRPTSFSSANSIVNKVSGSWKGYSLETIGTNGNLLAHFDSSANDCSTNTNFLPLNQWSHVSVAYDGSKNKAVLYFNGEAKKVCNVPSSLTANTVELRFGKRASGTAWQFSGNEDDVRIYNRALSPDEVKQLSEWGPGPAAYYNFDGGSGGTVYDKSGNGNNGTWYGTGNHWANGKYGEAAQFNGSSDYISIPDSASLEVNGSGTWEAWVKTDATFPSGARGGIIYKNYNYEYEMIMNDGGTVGGYNGDGSWEGIGELTGYTANQWAHITLVRNKDAKTYTWYLNGVQKTSGSYTKDVQKSSTTVYIGSRGGTTHYFEGLIDDVRVYNYSRTPKQIVEDMNAGHPVGGSPVGSPAVYYKMDEGYGTSTTQDSSQNNQDLTLSYGSGGSVPAWTNGGQFGRALDFEKDNKSFAYTADSTALSITSDLTVSAWIKPESVTAATLFDIAGKWDYSGSAKESYLLAQYGTELRMYIDSASNYKTTSGLGLAAGTRYYVAATYSASSQTVSLYVNGVDRGGSVTGTIPASIGDDTDRFHIGAEDSQGTAANFFDGIIDEVKVYNSALTADQITLDMNQGKELQLGGQVSATGATGQAAEYCVPGDSTSCAGPVGEWKLDEKTGTAANDTSGNGRSSDWSGTGNHWVRGKIGSAGQFNGSDDYLTIATNKLPDLGGSQTFSFWLKPANNSAGIILHRGGWCYDGSGGGWRVARNNNTSFGFSFQDSDHATDRHYTTTISTPANTWTYVTIVRSGSQLISYANGILSDTDTIVTTTEDDAADNSYIAMGDSGCGANDYFNGLIDQVQIFNYARTPAQIAWDYNHGKPISWWKFDEGEGASAYDSSGNSNTGTLQSMDPPTDWVSGKFNGALDFDGSNDYISTTASSAAPQDFSIGAWFKTSSASGKKIIGFENQQTGEGSGSYDRQLYVNTSGNLVFGCNWPASYITSSAIYNDNQWHFVMATHSASDNVAKMYIDGVYQGTFTSACQNYTGYWRIASYKLASWANGSDGYFPGQIDDARVYNFALTQAQVQQIYNNGAEIRFGD